ncbi:MAG: hypothetical protein ABIC91_00090 [Nanoarchaeota archaeon]|nr:hypothetical protein [Nanoarchaeota archaeon]MBU1029612.1 hypothetical protein [Nanoarchaeota archaeon]MBU1850235.1 hypothetical protein [Nanoarchaeota archaeon]
MGLKNKNQKEYKSENKKGVYFTLDAFFASVLLITGIILLSKFSIQEINTEKIDMLSKDLLSGFSELKTGDLNISWINQDAVNGSIYNLNHSVLEQIGMYWALGETEKARNLSFIVSESLIPENFGFSIVIDGETIYEKPKEKTRDLVSAQRMISGIAKDSPVEGTSSSAYLRKIRNKRTSAYAYFGGFVGQGNITVLMEELPSNIASSKIISLEMELDSAETFNLLINGYLCNQSNTTSEFELGFGNMTPDYWNITHCKDWLNPGRNNFSIIFQTFTNNSYIAGGYIKVDYNTNETVDNSTHGIKRYNFPEIDGIVNLYDSFYVPGTLNSMKIYLHYFFNHTNSSNVSTYLTIGSDYILNDTTSTTEQTILLNDSDIAPLLNYSFLSNKTVPIRVSSYKHIFEEVISGGNADVILITDYSGSMKKALYDWGQGNAGGDCDTAFGMFDIRRTELAVCLDNIFVDIVMNYEGNKLWPVFLHGDVAVYYNDPTNTAGIKSYISGFSQGNGKTCLACAVNQGYNILSANSNSSRQKFIVLMTDGVATHCADGSCNSNSSIYGIQQCEGLCDTTGACDVTEVPGQCSDCTVNDGGTDNILYSANRAKNDLNVTFYTIGFGPINDCSLANSTLHQIASVGNGSYQHSNNVSLLKLIYENIAYDILEKSTQYSQKVAINSSTEQSIMYGDSYIELNYTPNNAPISANEISITFQTEQFNGCNPQIELYDGVRFFDARITSYSAEHWTEMVSVNDEVIYNLTEFDDNYIGLGDPYIIELPVSVLRNGLNNISIVTADSPDNKTGCSNNNTLIYRALVNYSSARSSVVEMAEGCIWEIEFEDSTTTNISVPNDYAGSNQCYYTNSSVEYNPVDAYDLAAFGIFQSLDLSSDGKILFNFESEDLEIVVNILRGVPYMWGPAIVEARIWQ